MSIETLPKIIAEANPSRAFPFGVEWDSKRLLSLKNNSLFSPLVVEIFHYAKQANADSIAELPFSLFHLFESTGDRIGYEQHYFARRGRLAALVFACLLEGENTYLSKLEDYLWAICNEYTWSLPAHVSNEEDGIRAEHTVDLFAAETAQCLAEILVMLEERLHPAVAKRMRYEVERRILTPMFGNAATRLGWETVDNNWAAVCAGSVGMAALILVDDRARLAEILKRLIQAMHNFLEGYGEDGGCAEGISYWVYGFGYYVYFAEMLIEYTNGQVNLMESEKVRAIAAFPSSVYLSKGVFVNFSDAAEFGVLHTGLLSRLAARTGQAFSETLSMTGFHKDPCYRWAHMIRNLLWTDLSLFTNQVKTGSKRLADLQWVIDRRGDEQRIFGFAAKGGHNDEPHNHNDLGHFIIHVGGKNMLVDLGAGKYTKEYFAESSRYEILNNSSAGHSVPVINGFHQQAGAKFAAEVLLYDEHDTGLQYKLNLTNAYPAAAGVRQFTRLFRWEYKESKAQLMIEDQFKFNEDQTPFLEECFMSSIPPLISPDTVGWSHSDGAKLTLAYEGKQFKASFEELHSFDHEGDPIVVYRTLLKSEPAENEISYRLQFVLE